MDEHLETPQEEHVVYEFFLWGVLYKGAVSIIEVISGIAAFFIPPAFIVNAATLVLNHVPVPAIQSALLSEVAAYTGGAVTFVALYLISRGLVKCFLIFALLKNKLWAYPTSLVVLGLFLIYQIYQIVTSHSLLVIAITVFDLIVMYFIWREWRIAKRHRQPAIHS